MISEWQAKVTKPGSISLFYKFKTRDVRDALIDIRKVDCNSKFKDLKYIIFSDLAVKMAQNNSDKEPIVSVTIFNVKKESN